MVDLETLSTRMDAHILTIGAIAFDPVTFAIKDTFYERIDHKSCETIGLHKCDNTLRFWKSQPKNVYDEAFNAGERKPISDVMKAFVQFWNKNSGHEFWCNGANFDEPILSTIFDKLSMEKPWKFWNVRCLRTLLAINGLTMKQFGVVSHNALDDCTNQLKAYVKCMKE